MHDRRRPHRARARLVCALLTLAPLGANAGCAGGGASSATTPAGAESATARAFAGTLLPVALPPREFALTDQSGGRVSSRSLRGRVAIVAFLYASSEHAAPLIAQQIRGALDELALRRGAPAVPALAISVDPASDTPARVRAFLRANSLTGRLEYLSGSRAQLRALWRAYRVVPAAAGEAAYEAGAFVLLLDRTGAGRVEIPLEELTPEVLARDVRALEAL